MAKKKGRSYGWVKDVADERDFGFEKISAGAIPPKVTLVGGCSPVEDQGQLGSCTANALVGALEYLEIAEKQPFVDLSRLMLYYDERAIEGTVGQDAGAMLRDGIKTLAKQGVCPEKEWPYKVTAFAKKPTAQCYADAAAHKIASYYRIVTLADMLNCIAQGFPFVFGCQVFEEIESQQVAQTGKIPMPAPGEQPIGGHAMLAVGYSTKSRLFIVRNSWGASWGVTGYATMPFAYLDNPNLTQDCWTVRR